MTIPTSIEIVDNIIKDYNNYIPLILIAKKYGLHRSTVQRILIRNNITLRKRMSFLKLNRFFFSEYNRESCYWAGFILADGYIKKTRNTLKIALAKKDTAHLYKFLKCLECDEDIVSDREYASIIEISFDTIKQDLYDNFGIMNNKTFIADISKKIPFNYLSHFIRGYFDGDGCITYTSCPTISFVGNIKIIKSLINYFNFVNFKTKNKKEPTIITHNNIDTILYYGNAAKQVLDVLYEESTELTRLDRKYNLYLKYFKNN